MGVTNDGPLVSVVLPCLNEEAAIGACIEKIQATFAKARIDGEIVVCDNGSTDQSVAIAERLGARVVHQPLARLRQRVPQGLRQRPGPYLDHGRRRRYLRLYAHPQLARSAHHAGATTS